MKRTALLTAALIAATPAAAQSDPRLQTIPYVPNTVTTVRVVPGYVTTIVLGQDERVVSIALGNSAAWEVTPSKAGDHLFVKSLGAGAATNVEVVTDSRQYSFLLQSSYEGDPQAAFRLAFDYAAPSAPPPPPADPNGPAIAVPDQPLAEYRVSGDRIARPSAIGDDGRETRFEFPADATLPAIYAIDDQGHELLVTTREVDGARVVDRVWQRYVLRLGKATARVERRLPRTRR